MAQAGHRGTIIQFNFHRGQLLCSEYRQLEFLRAEAIIQRLTLTQIALVCFFVLASIICLVAGITVFLPSSPLSAIWMIKPDAFAELIEIAPWSGLGFLALSVLMGFAAWGGWQRRLWGWRLAIAIFIANGAGDVWQILSGQVSEGAFGVAVVVVIVLWLTRYSVKSAFR